jgi:hypothetical protein
MMELRERGENDGGEPKLARHPRGDHGQRWRRWRAAAMGAPWRAQRGSGRWREVV